MNVDDGVSEPDSDGGDVDGAAEDVVAFVVAGGDGAVLAELVDGPFHDVALPVDVGGRTPVAGRRAPVGLRRLIWSAGSGMVALMPLSRRDVRILRLEYALSASTRSGRVRGPARAAGDADAGQSGEGQRVVPLPGGGHPRQRPTAGVGGDVDLARHAAPRAAQALPVTGPEPGFV